MEPRPGFKLSRAAAALLLAATIVNTSAAPAAGAPACAGTIYLTFDTGSQSQAELIANTLRKHKIKATFFLANEKTVRGDWSLDPAWADYWKARVAEGHAFGTHTFDHVYWKGDAPGSTNIRVKPQFGAHAGQEQTWTAQQYCDELRRVDTRFHALTGRHIDPIFRAPGGHTSPKVLAAAQSCGYSHVGWARAGFSGDETPSETNPNPVLLKRALDRLKDGDIFMAHMGIWSRKDPWAPANLEPLISGLEQKGFCFATLREHPGYASNFKK
jgi:peptidoglycan/xylan/chitin deacetylase (PgdA/CDA1 family)